jgi:hypothetical protein
MTSTGTDSGGHGVQSQSSHTIRPTVTASSDVVVGGPSTSGSVKRKVSLVCTPIQIRLLDVNCLQHVEETADKDAQGLRAVGGNHGSTDADVSHCGGYNGVNAPYLPVGNL